jgi:hypothetical protein
MHAFLDSVNLTDGLGVVITHRRSNLELFSWRTSYGAGDVAEGVRTVDWAVLFCGRACMRHAVVLYGIRRSTRLR